MRQTAIAIDQLINTLLGGFSDETFSARCWRNGNAQFVNGIIRPGNARWDRARNAVDRLFFWQKQHCFESYVAEYERKQLPEEYRK